MAGGPTPLPSLAPIDGREETEGPETRRTYTLCFTYKPYTKKFCIEIVMKEETTREEGGSTAYDRQLRGGAIYGHVGRPNVTG